MTENGTTDMIDHHQNASAVIAAGRRRIRRLLVAALIALATVGANQNFPFGGASILIIVGVGLETVKQIDAQLQQRHYEGLLR